ncbi:hypothetical protein GCM10009840_22100 [Pseudolysinimonas kribbensis]|uniref:DUF3558 domain-containing protein n=1 Tax=Pseudolysinimonas kribbensis TaxID=433641 RepID=A0ABQ6KCP2_9MICO|nr:hypothetical protein [Pseudolysinimonas kribbensis]GMA97068.1 hypothetical protein GCM10025881_38920 [Pseudolysinimonas kribbensis]
MRIRAVIAAAAVLLSLAGCTSGASPVPRVSIPGLLGGGGATGTAQPLDTSDICAVFPVAAVATSSGWRLSSATAGTSTAGSAPAVQCTYSGVDGTLRLLAAPGGDDAALTALIASPDLGGGAIVVTGLGDAAQAALDGIVVRYGDDVLAIVEKPATTALPLAITQRLVISLRDRLTR